MEKDHKPQSPSTGAGHPAAPERDSAVNPTSITPVALNQAEKIVIPDECGDSLWEDVLAQKPE
ncbi:MAG: hypothetical protein EOO09_20480 [Chitinophagaceae bacterium]|nr:MAG: hypothetical protein EOO09_20480 [Chitinophagaceae bacterium]